MLAKTSGQLSVVTTKSQVSNIESCTGMATQGSDQSNRSGAVALTVMFTSAATLSVFVRHGIHPRHHGVASHQYGIKRVQHLHQRVRMAVTGI